MLVENQTVLVRWNQKIKKHYVDRGYTFTKYGDDFEVRVEDLTSGSHVKVKVKCDYCEEIIEKTYQKFLVQHDEKLGDCCVKCRVKKKELVCLEKYGVKSTNMLEEVKDKKKQVFLEKYGVENPFQSEECKEKMKETWIKKYGVDRPSKSSIILEKATQTMLERGHVYTSKQQITLNEILKTIYGESLLNYRCGKYALDSMIEVNGIKIDIEYDGAYWHDKMKQHDEERNNYVVSRGYKVLRFVSDKDIVPTNTLIESSVNELINSNKNILIVTL